MPFLTAEPAHLGYRHSDDSDSCERLLDVVELERLDDRLDLFHRASRRGCLALAMPEWNTRLYISNINYLYGDAAEPEKGSWLPNRQELPQCLSIRQGAEAGRSECPSGRAGGC